MIRDEVELLCLDEVEPEDLLYGLVDYLLHNLPSFQRARDLEADPEEFYLGGLFDGVLGEIDWETLGSKVLQTIAEEFDDCGVSVNTVLDANERARDSAQDHAFREGKNDFRRGVPFSDDAWDENTKTYWKRGWREAEADSLNSRAAEGE